MRHFDVVIVFAGLDFLPFFLNRPDESRDIRLDQVRSARRTVMLSSVRFCAPGFVGGGGCSRIGRF